MPTSPAEKTDLETMKAEIAKIKISAFDLMHEYGRMTADELGHCGYRIAKYGTLPATRDAAILTTQTRAEIEIENLHKAFLKRWPD